MTGSFKKYIILILIVTPFFNLQAQTNTSSPYSRFGIGDLDNVAYGRNLALGGSGIGLRDSRFLNLRNPASLTAIDSLSFLFETGVNFKYTLAQSTDRSQTYMDGNITHLMFGHRFTPWLMGSAGLMPYTSIGYNILTTKSVENELATIQTNWRGTGGINKYFYSLGLKLSKNFSLGTEVAFLYGPYQEDRTTTLSSLATNSTRYVSSSQYSAFLLNLGFQYTAQFGEKGTGLTVGATYQPAQFLNKKSEFELKQTYAGSFVDTIYMDDIKTQPITIPDKIGAGASFTYQGKYLVSADYEMQNWSVNKDIEYIDQSIFSIGFEKLPQNSLKFLERSSYRVGFRYDSGYVRANGISIDDMRLTLGYGLPLKNSGSMVNFTFEFGQRGTKNSGLILDRYAKATVSFSMFDVWFKQRKFN